MSTLLDEETVLTEQLDEQPPCEVAESDGAVVAVLCRGCRHTILLCRSHCAKVLAALARRLLERPLKCKHCGHVSRSLHETIEVVDL
ncbi:hypothetical protein [Microbacterium sp. YY-01]|uniref:hypothetical protein n=1 Tax=Microbacterium sp. YY-01 TaxID=3421634 RepID=UPI003D178AF1